MVTKGVGSNLQWLFSRLGIKPDPDCSCELLKEIMDDLGPVGCRDKRDDLLKLMRKNAKKYGWDVRLMVGVRATILVIRSPKEWGWLLKIDPLDPLAGFLDKSIEMAEQDG